MENRCVAASLDGFIHYLVTGLICRGYWFYVTGLIPAGKSLEVIDAKMMGKYQIAVSPSTRWRRKKSGLANVRYFRFGRFFVLMATKGKSDFFEQESDIKDIRKHPIRFGGYSISFRRDSLTKSGQVESGYRVHVRIDDTQYKELVSRFEHFATQMSGERLAARLYELPFRGYAPVRNQLCQLLRKVNKRRKKAGKPVIPKECLFFHRKAVRVFDVAKPQSAVL